MKKLLIAFLLVLSTSIFAQEKPVVSTTLGIDVSNTYLLRGVDYYSSQLADSTSVFNLAPMVMPSVTVNVGDSLFFNILNIDSLISRTDLAGYDELDFTVGYVITDTLGSIVPTVSAYTFPYATDFNYTELAIEYASSNELLHPSLLFITSLGLPVNFNYFKISISHDFTMSRLTISPKLSIGNFVDFNDLNSSLVHADIDLPVSYAINDSFEVHLLVTGSYRIMGYDSTISPFTLNTTLGTSYSF